LSQVFEDRGLLVGVWTEGNGEALGVGNGSVDIGKVDICSIKNEWEYECARGARRKYDIFMEVT
jgi:hypothetical protein